MKNKASVKGLANIASLIGRSDISTAPPRPRITRASSESIVERTVEKISAAVGANSTATQMALVKNYVQSAIRDTYNIGHADALDQNSQVERLLEKQFDARTKVTMPAVAAGFMEQMGLTSMTLDLAHLATVFSRNQIDYTLSDENVISYRLLPLDVVQA
jgi:hypothetical protein